MLAYAFAIATFLVAMGLASEFEHRRFLQNPEMPARAAPVLATVWLAFRLLPFAFGSADSIEAFSVPASAAWIVEGLLLAGLSVLVGPYRVSKPVARRHLPWFAIVLAVAATAEWRAVAARRSAPIETVVLAVPPARTGSCVTLYLGMQRVVLNGRDLMPTLQLAEPDGALVLEEALRGLQRTIGPDRSPPCEAGAIDVALDKQVLFRFVRPAMRACEAAGFPNMRSVPPPVR